MLRRIFWMLSGLLLLVGQAQANDGRYVVMRGEGEYSWNIGRVSPITNEAEGEVLAGNKLLKRLENMANLEAFERFTNSNVSWSLNNLYKEFAGRISNQTSIAHEKDSFEAFRGNQRGLVITVRTMGFRPGSYGSRYERDPITGVRKSSAWGILRYQFTVYGPNPQALGVGAAAEQRVRVAVLPNGGRIMPQPDGTWAEIDPAGQIVNRLRQVHRDAQSVVIRDDIRRIALSLPFEGGLIYFQYDGQQVTPWGHIRWE